MFTVDRDKLERDENNASLLANLWPPGFEVGGRHVLEECDEMTLYELYEPGGEQAVVLAPEIMRILLRHLLRINDSWETEDRDRRVARAIALKRLHHFTVHRHRKGEMVGSVQTAQALAESLGEEIDEVINSDDIEASARRFANRMTESVKALAREQGRLPDLRTNKDRISAPARLIREAQTLFMLHPGKPPSAELIGRMEELGYLAPENDKAGYWSDTFCRAGLSSWR
jgi:hypothetical protein